ncbi:MAG TPA: ferritin-like domain-containing protein [Tepidisphaeraceae bacterium]
MSQSSEEWREYFHRNAASLLPIPWHQGVTLTQAERDAIASSMQEFQLGESSEGKHFQGLASEYAQLTGDHDYVYALRLFIAEEHRHARDLGRVLDLAGIPRTAHTWPDAVFRWLRHRAGLELSISVLVTAEIIARVYYAALREATSSPVLRSLCDQILADEEYHVRFQCERLAILRARRSRLTVCARALLQRFFFAGTCRVVWWKHRHALRAGGFRYRTFRRAARAELDEALKLMDPVNYVFGPVVDARQTAAPAPVIG